MIELYHNPRCSKSRKALELLQDSGQEVKVIPYLQTPPTAAELKTILSQLQLKPMQLLRTGEKLYKEEYKGKTLTDEEWVQVMVENPVLLERPIAVHGNKAVVGRPPEKVLDIV